ncbi:MAG TPA: four helix bundle protein [Aggregatilineales bacterium]|nr:four helix bundle protein [Aggregatilineales bacterium]
MSDYRKLEVWAKAHQLTLEIYRATKTFPKDELYGLVSQMHRAASSIPMNIAEGSGRGSNADYARCVQIGLGSMNELEYQLLLARDLGFLTEAHFQQMDTDVKQIGRMLVGLMRHLRST